MSSNIHHIKFCADINCKAPANGSFAFCSPCYKIRTAMKRPCDMCKVIIDVPSRFRLHPGRHLPELICESCDISRVKAKEIARAKDSELWKIRSEMLTKHLLETKARDIVIEKKKNIYRLITTLDEKSEVKIDFDSLVDVIYDLMNKIDDLESQLKVD